MRTFAITLACTTAAILTALPGRLAAQGFEGVITSHMTMEGGHTVEVVYQVKGNKARWESHSPELEKMGGAATIYDFDAGTMTSIVPAKKMYMVMNFREMAKTAEGMSDSKKSKPDRFPKMTKTGKKETIAGYPCEHWLIGDEQTMDMCLAKGLGFWGMGGASGRGGLRAAFHTMDRAELEAQVAAHPEVKELVDGGAFPLKMENQKDRKFSMVVTKIERKSLSNDLFQPPAGYTEMNMGRMMEQMQKRQGKPPTN